MIIRACLMLVFLQAVDGLMCYFCADTSSQDGRNQCQTWQRTMKYYRKRFEQSGSFKVDKYVKNCTSYGDPDGPKYCMIAYLEERGERKTFIRDCSDGTSFFSEEIDTYFEEQRLNPDNQTKCQTSLQNGFVACVTLCGRDQFGTGDFCNGPVLVSSATPLLSALLTMTSLLCIFSYTVVDN